MSWLRDRASALQLLATRPDLARQLRVLRDDASNGAPGRTAGLITARAQQIVTGSGSLGSFGALTDAEQVVVDVTEQFLIDAHGIDDSLIARLSGHYNPAEQVAIMFHLALADGFTKFNRVFDVPATDPVTEAD
jgi:hypothetical protein